MSIPLHYSPSGELYAPTRLESSHIFPKHGRPSKKKGEYLKFAFKSRSEAEFYEKSDRFFREMGAIEGYSTIDLCKTITKDSDGNDCIWLTVTYVIEIPGYKPVQTRPSLPFLPHR